MGASEKGSGTAVLSRIQLLTWLRSTKHCVSDVPPVGRTSVEGHDMKPNRQEQLRGGLGVGGCGIAKANMV